MKGIILAAGKGTRINKFTDGNNKCLLTIGNTTIIQQNVQNLCALEEIDECIIVVGFGSENIIKTIGNMVNGKKIRYIIQQKQNGLIAALETAITLIGTSDVFMVLGDEYILKNNYSLGLKIFHEMNYDCLIGAIKTPNFEEIKKTYTFEEDGENNIFNFIEKPCQPISSFQGTGNIIIKNHVLNLLKDIPINEKRNERDLTDLFNILTKKHKIYYFIVAEKYFNINTITDYRLLKENCCEEWGALI